MTVPATTVSEWYGETAIDIALSIDSRLHTSLMAELAIWKSTQLIGIHSSLALSSFQYTRYAQLLYFVYMVLDVN